MPEEEQKKREIKNIRFFAKEHELPDEWHVQLAMQLGITPHDLIEMLKDYHASNEVPEDLRKTYPTERGIETLGTAIPQKHTLDFVLSGLDYYMREERGEEIETTFGTFGADVMDDVKHRKYHKLEITKALAVENFRRLPFWKKRREQLDEMLCGTYVMHRCSLTRSREQYTSHAYREILHFKKTETFPQVLVAYWRRRMGSRRIVYVGNLHISKNFLYGTFVNNSTDQIIKPVNLCILSQHTKKQRVKNAVLTGSVTGTDDAQETIVHYPIALQKVDEDLRRKAKHHRNVTRYTFTEYADALLENPDIVIPHAEEISDFIWQKRTSYSGQDMNQHRIIPKGKPPER